MCVCLFCSLETTEYSNGRMGFCTSLFCWFDSSAVLVILIAKKGLSVYTMSLKYNPVPNLPKRASLDVNGGCENV